MNILVAILMVVSLILFGYLKWRQEEKERTNKKLTQERQKIRLKETVLEMVKAQESLSRECLETIRKEILYSACESYIYFQHQPEYGDTKNVRVPTTLWDILKWLTLRNTESTRTLARELELIQTSKRDAQYNGRTFHPHSTRRRIEVLLMKMHSSLDEREKANVQLDQQTMETFRELSIELTNYGDKLICRVPGQYST